MKFLVPLFILLLSIPAWAGGQPSKFKNFGIGFEIGSPTALTAKYYQDPSHAIDVGLGYWFGSYIEVFGDYLFHWPRAFSDTHEPGPQFVPYLGLGAEFHVASSSPAVVDNNHPSFGFLARIPLGMEWLPPAAPFGVFVEIVPAIQLIPGVAGYFGGDIGARFYF